MRYRRPYVLFKKKLSSGTKIWYFYIYDANNVRHQFSTGSKTRAEAEIYCMELYRNGTIAAARQGAWSSQPFTSQTNPAQAAQKGGSPLFGEYVRDWYVYDKCDYIQQKLLRGFNITRGYADSCRNTLERYISPSFGKYRLEQLTAELVNSWVLGMKKGGTLQNSSINRIVKVFKVILSDAYRRGDIQADIAKRVLLLKSDSKTHGILTKEEAAKLLNPKTVKKVWGGNRIHYAMNGLPWQEAYEFAFGKLADRILSWTEKRDVALQRQCVFKDHILVAHTWDVKYGLKDTKSHKSREVPISADVYRLLSDLSRNHTAGGFIFSEDGGKSPIQRTSAGQALHSALSNIGIGNEERRERFLSFHSWRHYVNTLLITSGVPKTVVQSIMRKPCGLLPEFPQETRRLPAREAVSTTRTSGLTTRNRRWISSRRVKTCHRPHSMI